jgi:predicted ATPase/class 3 adenylate cyclase
LEQLATATFLFTDIEGSTRILQQLGDAWPATLERHRELIRGAIASPVGEEIGTEGDSFFVVFPTVSGAFAAAVEAQRALAAEPWPQGQALRERMGLHTGEGRRSGQVFTGIDVHRAARIAAAGHGGQVLISDATRVLVASSLPSDVQLRDLGSHRLKDLVAPEHLYQLVIDGLAAEFPALRTLDAAPNNLPLQLTTFLGREREIGEIAALLEQHRLLTLTGPGGTGKTRLSLEVAARMLGRFPDGVFFVSLSPLHEVELVAPTIGHALGLPDSGGRAPEERIVDHLGEKHVLLVLDNFEQLVPAAPLVNELLTRAPNLSCLVTSRESLHLYGEHEYAVPPLGVPPLERGGRPLDGAGLSQYEAVALFIERATAVRPDFAVTNENAPAVAELCIRLDGLPLAIELAAARTRILGPEAILQRLGDRLQLLSGGGSDRPERQQTLRGAIAWSYDLLDDADRRLFAALSVFEGGATFEAIDEVCGPVVQAETLDGVASLVDKSLVRQRETNGEPRFSMLHTIREFAAEIAGELGVADDLRGRHARYFANMASRAAAVIMSSDKRTWLDRLMVEHDNLRLAIGWGIESRDATLALNLVADLWRFWQMRGFLDEGLDRVRAALALPEDDESAAARGRGLEAAGGLSYWQGDMAVAEDYYSQAMERQRRTGDEHGIADALYNLSFVYAIPSATQMANPGRTAELVGEALELYRRIGDRAGVARCLWSLSNGAWITGDVAQGEVYASEGLDVFRDIDDRFLAGWSLYTIGMMRIQTDRLEAAAEPLREALAIFSEAADVSGYVLVLDGLAAEAYRLGDLERSARLAAAVARLQETTGTGLTPANRELVGFTHEPLIADPALAGAWAEGARLSATDAVAYGMEPATDRRGR